MKRALKPKAGTEATAEVFVTAFESLPKKTQKEILLHFVEDPARREDLMDLALCFDRRREKGGRSLKAVMSG